MPKIPEFGNVTMHGTRMSVPNYDGGSSGLSSAANQFANLLVQKSKEDDQLKYQKALLDLQDFSNTEMNDPTTGFKSLQGEKALSEGNKYNQRYLDKTSKIRETLKGNRFLKNFDLQTQAMHTTYSRQILEHQSQQQKALSVNIMKSGIDLALTDAQSLYNDPMSLDIGYKAVASRINEFSAEHGVPEEARKTHLESVKQGYFSSALDGWVAHTEVSEGSFAALKGEIKKSFAFKQLSEINQAKYMFKLDGLIKQQGAKAKDSLKLDLTNAWNAQIRGKQAPEIPLSRFNEVFGDKGKLQYDMFQDGQKLAQNIESMANIPTSDLMPYLKEDITEGNEKGGDLTANTSDPKFTERLRAQNARKNAAVTLLNLRREDPIAAAAQAGRITPLDPSNITGSLSARMAQSEGISHDYGTPVRVLTNAESLQMDDMLKRTSPAEQVNLLKQWSNSAGSNRAAFEGLLGDLGRNNPAFAAAGEIVGNGDSSPVTLKYHYFSANETATRQDIAQTILTGADARRKGELHFGMKKDGSVKEGREKSAGRTIETPPKAKVIFDEQTQGMFEGDVDSRNAMYETVMSYYTGKAIQQGDYDRLHELDENALATAITAVAGGKSDKYNVRMPWGVDEDVFNQRIAQSFTKIAQTNGWVSSNLPGSDIYIADKFKYEYTLSPVTSTAGLPTGVYYVRAGGALLRQDNGELVRLDINEDTSTIEEIPK